MASADLYGQLRRMAAAQMAREAPGRTLQATALVHEAYLRLLAPDGSMPGWDSRGHFFAAAATAMRRILVEQARARRSQKRGGGGRREHLADDLPEPDFPGGLGGGGETDPARAIEMVDLDAALSRLESHDPRAFRVVMLRYFAGLSLEQTAEAMDLSLTTVKATWTYARAWLRRAMSQEGASGSAGPSGEAD